MNFKTTLALIILGTAVVASTAPAKQNTVSPNSSRATLQVGPSFEDLLAELQTLRRNKKYDWEHGRKYQQAMAARIQVIKQALRNHHRERGRKAAMNDPMDYDPPR